MNKRDRGLCEPALAPTQVRLVNEYIRAKIMCNVRVGELADQVHLSPHYFSTLFKHSVGVSPHRYVLRECIQEAQRRLAAGGAPISEIALSLGFSDQSHFSETFRKITGTTPKQFQRSYQIQETKAATRMPNLRRRSKGYPARIDKPRQEFGRPAVTSRV
jgi:AraC-like DNA-binding protein